MELRINLDEVDEKFDISKVTGILTETTIGECLDLSGYTSYIKLGTEIYDKIADITVKNDPLWSEQFVLKADFQGGAGAAALRNGTYALVATSDSRGNNLRYWDEGYSNVFYKGKHLHIGKKEEHIKTNLDRLESSWFLSWTCLASLCCSCFSCSFETGTCICSIGLILGLRNANWLRIFT